jgi:hypothetical protein
MADTSIVRMSWPSTAPERDHKAESDERVRLSLRARIAHGIDELTHRAGRRRIVRQIPRRETTAAGTCGRSNRAKSRDPMSSGSERKKRLAISVWRLHGEISIG